MPARDANGVTCFADRIRDVRARMAALRNELGKERGADSHGLESLLGDLCLTLEELEVSQEEVSRQHERVLATRAELEAQRRRYRDLFEGAPCAYVSTDGYGNVAEANAAACRLLRVRAHLVRGRPLITCFAEDHRRPLREQLSAVLLNRIGATWESRLAPDEDRLPRPVAVTVEPVIGPGGSIGELRWLLMDVPESPRLASRIRRAGFVRGVEHGGDAGERAPDWNEGLDRLLGENDRLRAHVERLEEELMRARGAGSVGGPSKIGPGISTPRTRLSGS